MHFEYRQVSVSLSDIDSENEAFRITTNSRIDDLAGAMDRIGLSTPPILRAGTVRQTVICGFRRIYAAKSLGWKHLPARILPEDVGPLSCALLSISENSIERPLNLIERSRAYSLLSTLIKDTGELVETLEKVGLPATPSLIDKMRPLCEMPWELQEGLIAGTLALPCAIMLSRLDNDTAVAIAVFVKNLKLSLHKQREFIDLVSEISKLEECSIESILASSAIHKILANPETDLPRKALKIRAYLKQRRFPHLFHAQEAFENLASSLKLGQSVSIKPPAGFESNRYTITQSFGSLAEFETQVNSLAQLAANKAFVQLLHSRDPHRN